MELGFSVGEVFTSHLLLGKSWPPTMPHLEGRQGKSTGCSEMCRWRIHRPLGYGMSWVMAYHLIGSSSCFFPSSSSFVSSANSVPSTSTPRSPFLVEPDLEALRKLGTISSSLSPKELRRKFLVESMSRLIRIVWVLELQWGTQG